MSAEITNTAEARRIAGEWYKGDYSGLYAVLSCRDYRRFSGSQWIDAYVEAKRERGNACDKHDEQELSRLMEWIEYKANEFGYRLVETTNGVGYRIECD